MPFLDNNTFQKNKGNVVLSLEVENIAAISTKAVNDVAERNVRKVSDYERVEKNVFCAVRRWGVSDLAIMVAEAIMKVKKNTNKVLNCIIFGGYMWHKTKMGVDNRRILEILEKTTYGQRYFQSHQEALHV